MLSFVFLIPLLPLLGAALNGAFGRKIGSEKLVGSLAAAAVLLAFLL